ncbi:MAG TPA: M1 family metallopeptidase [Flavobacteriaceae bacterium]|nr:M1 family metallopeptidase [Flavobacteriaceae bacterium]MCB9213759.1 M1 family metallopeptidase [Alteromonas sp.]HPF11324.1 M1 family metallopeptidase [Flavobacteriaceae bacterium]HQU22161.1 M1 family metallopeptidase [Flavobacteriaceae bacterium]HQU64457.1 M1 family metallopeptidase [Flavobacteriaceae bacterium]
MKKTLLLLVLLLTFVVNAQSFTHQDTLRGSITPERAWWDLKHYNLSVKVAPEDKSIEGINTFTYLVLEANQVMQIDLQPPMKLDKVVQHGKVLSFQTDGNAHFITLKELQRVGTEGQLTLYFSGKPQVAKHPPWDGGFTWSQDSNGNPFIATSNQGIGASIWWPNKDHPYDEPDRGVDLTITAPKDLVAVGNGRLVETLDLGAMKSWHWKVVNPINNYAVNVNIGDYVSFSEIFEGKKGHLDLQYWVLRENLEKAKKQFLQVPMMMQAFEHWFGPYPFYEDGYKLVEVPYLGMEHQSSVTYGNKYANGYLGRDLSGSGWGLDFDFIIIHESGHEWFANNITNKDVADMWLHEGFTAYSENLYLDYHFGKKASSDYVTGTRMNIRNDRPIIGPYNVNKGGSGDMYYKGANILHQLRQLIEDDEKWRRILTGLNGTFYHQTVTTKQVEDYISDQTGIDLTEYWQQYLRTTKIPKLEYRISGNTLQFRYVNIIEKFDMPLFMFINGKEEWIFPTASWKTKTFDAPIESAQVKIDFFVDSEVVK